MKKWKTPETTLQPSDINLTHYIITTTTVKKEEEKTSRRYNIYYRSRNKVVTIHRK